MINRVKQIRLKTGEGATIRQGRADDVERIRELYARSSENSIYQRYLRHTQPTLEEIEALCRLDPNRGTVLVAVVDAPHEMVVGYAYYVIDPNFKPYIAEPAVMIEGNYQGIGLGSQLCLALFEDAHERHIYAFELTVSLTNDPMMAVIRKSGLRYTQTISDGTRDIFIVVNPEPEQPVITETNIHQLINFLMPEQG